MDEQKVWDVEVRNSHTYYNIVVEASNFAKAGNLALAYAIEKIDNENDEFYVNSVSSMRRKYGVVREKDYSHNPNGAVLLVEGDE